MTSREQRIGLLGCGAIGRGLALAVDEGKVPGAVLVALFDQDESAARSLAQRLKGSPKPVSSFDDIAAPRTWTWWLRPPPRRLCAGSERPLSLMARTCSL